MSPKLDCTTIAFLLSSFAIVMSPKHTDATYKSIRVGLIKILKLFNFNDSILCAKSGLSNNVKVLIPFKF